MDSGKNKLLHVLSKVWRIVRHSFTLFLIWLRNRTIFHYVLYTLIVLAIWLGLTVSGKDPDRKYTHFLDDVVMVFLSLFVLITIILKILFALKFCPNCFHFKCETVSRETDEEIIPQERVVQENMRNRRGEVIGSVDRTVQVDTTMRHVVTEKECYRCDFSWATYKMRYRFITIQRILHKRTYWGRK